MRSRKQYIAPERLRELFGYDAETGVLTWKQRDSSWFKDGFRTAQGEANNWNTRYAGKSAGYLASVGYRYVALPGNHRVPEHRIIWAICYDEWPDTIDHINGIKTDNRISNLRNVTQSVNMKNAAMWSHNTSGVTGVMFDKRAKKWKSYIKVGSKMINLGHSEDFEAAVSMRLAAEDKYGFTARHGVSSWA